MRVLRRAFVAASIAWAAALPAAAWTVAGSRHPVLAACSFLVYTVGAIVCHQLPDRSFHLWGVQLAVCARCTGIYAASAVIALAGRVLPRATQPTSRRVLIACGLPTAATRVFEWTTGQTPSNTLRALAGVPIGAAVAWVIAGL
jgi:uncharacterized membrane protein